MDPLKLKKTKTLRRRFIKSAAPLSSMNDWSDAFFDLKEVVLGQSTYQLIGDKGVIQVDSRSGEAHVLLEVVGVPKPGLEFLDHEGGQVLVFEHPKTAFDVDFLTLKQEARAIMSKIPGTVAPIFHIVVKGHHLALHFFI